VDCASIDAPSSDHLEYQKNIFVTKICYVFLLVNELVDSIYVDFFTKRIYTNTINEFIPVLLVK